MAEQKPIGISPAVLLTVVLTAVTGAAAIAYMISRPHEQTLTVKFEPPEKPAKTFSDDEKFQAEKARVNRQSAISKGYVIGMQGGRLVVTERFGMLNESSRNTVLMAFYHDMPSGSTLVAVSADNGEPIGRFKPTSGWVPE